MLLLVGSLMFVVILMTEARKAKYWTWLTGPSGGPLTPAELGGEDIDTRVQPTIVTGGQFENLPGAVVTPTFRFRPAANLDDEALAYRRAEMDFWRQQLELLDWRDRRRLPQVLKAVRDKQPLESEDTQAWEATLQTLGERWQEYPQKAMDSVTVDPNLTDEDRATWLLMLHRLQKHWNEHLYDALAAAPDPQALTEDQSAELDRFQMLFDEMSIGAIRDDTVVSRPAEANAWFRMLEDLQQTDQQALAELEVPRVGFRQLFKQPDEYRGRLVRIRGEAKRAYHLQAPGNIAGIEGYYKFIVFPAGGPSSPVMVYALELPEGFPEVKDLDVDKEVTDFDEMSVEFTGYFFKRTAYQAGDGTRVAPLILAKQPTWTPKVAEGDPPLPNLWLLGTAVIGMALLGTGIAAFVMARHGATPAQQYAATSRAKPQQFAALQDEELAPPPDEELRRLESEASSTE